MSLENFNPTIWSARLLNTLKTAHVFANVVNNDYEGDVTAYGDSVKINSIGEVSVSDYTKNTDISDPEDLDAVQTILQIDQAKYFNFQVDDVDKVQQRPKVMDAAMQEAGFALADTADGHIASFHDKAAQEVTEDFSANEEDNTYKVLAETARKLDEKNVPRTGRFAVVPPFFHEYMIVAGILDTAGSIDANQLNQEGFIGRLLGFDIYMSNNLKVVGSDTMGLAGTRKAISYAEQILDMEAYRPEKRFADAVKGLHVYGAKVVYPKALVRLKLQAI